VLSTGQIGIILLVISVTLVAINPALGQGFDEESCPDCEGSDVYAKRNQTEQNGITIWTDSSHYERGDFIKLFGEVDDYVPNLEVGLVVIGPPPFNNVVAIDTIDVEVGNTFATTLSTTGNSWKYDGTYTIKVTYGNQAVNDRVQINLGIVDPTPISLTTDKSSYTTGNVIVISGTSDPDLVYEKKFEGLPQSEFVKLPVSIHIITSLGNLASIEQILVDDTGKFSTSVIASGVLWQDPGLYRVVASHGAQSIEVKFWFNYPGGNPPPIPHDPIPEPIQKPEPIHEPKLYLDRLGSM